MKFSRSPRRFHRLAGRTSVLATAEICEARCLLTSYSLGELPSSYSHSSPSDIDASNRNNTYRFNLNTSSNLRIAVWDIDGNSDVRVQLSNSSGLVRSATFSRIVNSPVLEIDDVDPGAYTLTIQTTRNYSEVTDYTLYMERDDLSPPPSDRDAIRSGANPLGSITGVDGATGSVNFSDDEVDYYQFRIEDDGDVNIQLTGLSSDVDVYLEDSTGDLSQRGRVLRRGETRSSTAFENITATNLSAGVYYVRIDKYSSGQTDYSLRIEFEATNDDRTQATATDMGTLSGLQNTTGTVEYTNDEVDYFRFELLDAGSIRVRLSGLASDVDVYLEDNTGSVLGRGERRGSTLSEDFTVEDLAAGVYYIRVDKYASGETGYDLQVELLEPSLPDLVGSSFVVSETQVSPGDHINISYRLRNIGASAAQAVAVGFYLSQNTIISEYDYLLGADGYQSLDAGQTGGIESVSLQLPEANSSFWSGGSGTFYIGMIIDPSDRIEEESSANNQNRGNGLDRDSITVTVLPSGPRTQILGFSNGRWWASGDDGSGGYQNFEITGLPAVEPRMTLTGDFNGNGRDDLAIWLPNGEWHVASVAANGTVSVSHWTTWRTSNVKEIHVGDFNDDGRDDLIGLFKQGGRNRGRWWAGLSTGSKFQNRSWGDYGNYSGIASVQVGNFDGVKGDDLTVIASSGVLWMYKTSNSRFQYLNAGRWSMSGDLSHTQVGDFNGDNRLDVVGILGGGSNRTIQVAKSVGPANGFHSGNWSNLTVSQSLDGVVVGDFDVDGRDDVGVLLNGTEVWFGDSNGQKFALQYLSDWSAAAGGVTHLTAGDTNGDGRADVFGRMANGYWRALESGSTGVTDRQLSYWSVGGTWSQIQTGYFTNTPPAATAIPAVPAGGSSLEELHSDGVNASRWSSETAKISFTSDESEERDMPLTHSYDEDQLDEFAAEELTDLIAGLAVAS